MDGSAPVLRIPKIQPGIFSLMRRFGCGRSRRIDDDSIFRDASPPQLVDDVLGELLVVVGGGSTNNHQAVWLDSELDVADPRAKPISKGLFNRGQIIKARLGRLF